MSWPVIVSELYIKTSNVGCKIVKIVEIRFYWMKQFLSHKRCQRDAKHVENPIM